MLGQVSFAGGRRPATGDRRSMEREVNMQVEITREGAYSVTISGGFTGPYINLEISPSAAWDLIKALDAKREEIRDLAENYYDCEECGETHPKSARTCPNLAQQEEEE